MSWKSENNGFIKTWAQDIRNSYKIKLKYVIVPKGVKTEVRYIDTPYRFESYQEARAYAKQLFPCNEFMVDGSPDIPNFNETLVRTNRRTNVKRTNSNSNSDSIEDISKKLDDIQVLRNKLNEKEIELKKALK